MRIAIFSDVHGNLTALEAVLADIEAQQVDQVLFAGDLCLVGPRPAACVQRLQGMEITAVYGNTDDWLLGRQTPPSHLQALAAWTHNQLNQEERAWLAALPFAYELKLSEQAVDQLLLVHANPQDVNQPILPAEAVQVGLFEEVRQPDRALAALLSQTVPQTIAYGHVHFPNIRWCDNHQLVNVSSVSVPADGDARAKYALLTWQEGGWQATHRYVAYDIAAEVAAYRAAQPPGWQSFVETIGREGVFPQRL